MEQKVDRERERERERDWYKCEKDNLQDMQHKKEQEHTIITPSHTYKSSPTNHIPIQHSIILQSTSHSISPHHSIPDNLSTIRGTHKYQNRPSRHILQLIIKWLCRIQEVGYGAELQDNVGWVGEGYVEVLIVLVDNLHVG